MTIFSPLTDRDRRKKTEPEGSVLRSECWQRLECLDALSLRPFLAVRNGKLNALTF